MRLYLVSYDCLDYYCKGEHIRGIFDSKEEAQRQVDKLDERGDIAFASISPCTLNEIWGLEV